MMAIPQEKNEVFVEQQLTILSVKMSGAIVLISYWKVVFLANLIFLHVAWVRSLLLSKKRK